MRIAKSGGKPEEKMYMNGHLLSLRSAYKKLVDSNATLAERKSVRLEIRRVLQTLGINTQQFLPTKS